MKNSSHIQANKYTIVDPQQLVFFHYLILIKFN